MFQVIEPTDPQWDAVTSRIPDLDLFFTSAYARTQPDARAAIFQSRLCTIIKPFALRPIPQSDLFDIASLYGYGGAISNIFSPFVTAEMAEKFDAAFRDWCIGSRVVSEFCVYHPLLADEQDRLVPTQAANASVRKRVVAVDVDGSDQALLAQMRPTRRHSITAAQGVVSVVEVPAEAVPAFHRLYIQTMNRVGAADRWRWPVAQIASLAAMPGSRIFFGMIGADLESAALILSHGRTAYYHLSGNAMKHPRSGANDAVLYEIMKWCRLIGIEQLHLGGGVTEKADDSLLIYKMGFGGALHDVKTSFRLFMTEAYTDLCMATCRRMGDKYHSTDFVPAYRRDVA